jgi:hypothetical protein
MTPISMRFRDWLADHFRFVQYAKPQRSPKREHSFWREFARELLRVVLAACLLAAYFWRYRGDPGIRVFGLFAAALLAWCATHTASLLL